MAKKRQTELRSNTDTMKVRANNVCASSPAPISIGTIGTHARITTDPITKNVVQNGVYYDYNGMVFSNESDAISQKRQDIKTNMVRYQNKISEIKDVANEVQELIGDCQENVQDISNDLNKLQAFIAEVQGIMGDTGQKEYVEARSNVARGFGSGSALGPYASFQEIYSAIEKTSEFNVIQGRMNQFIELINAMIKELETCKKSLTTKETEMIREYDYWCRRFNSL